MRSQLRLGSSSPDVSAFLRIGADAYFSDSSSSVTDTLFLSLQAYMMLFDIYSHVWFPDLIPWSLLLSYLVDFVIRMEHFQR